MTSQRIVSREEAIIIVAEELELDPDRLFFFGALQSPGQYARIVTDGVAASRSKGFDADSRATAFINRALFSLTNNNPVDLSKQEVGEARRRAKARITFPE
ncbi:hypothetical protein LCGC14_0421960 [marine sediment metagenome]|uniref:Uncharacterized protein n=1 Tax=marine sediment metagenome TaxID=412755 RepID=A0A0F9VCK7_9ZZZZ